MLRIKLRPLAKADLDNIYEHTVGRWGKTQAIEYLRVLKNDVERVAINPEVGKRCDEVRAGFRWIVSGQHRVFYLSDEEVVDVVRILHTRMDAGAHLPEP